MNSFAQGHAAPNWRGWFANWHLVFLRSRSLSFWLCQLFSPWTEFSLRSRGALGSPHTPHPASLPLPCLPGSLGVSVNLCICVSMCVLVFLFVYLCFSVCPSMPVSVFLSMSMCLWLSMWLSVCICVCLYFCVCLFICVCLRLSLCAPLSLCFCASVCGDLCVFLWVSCLCVCLCLCLLCLWQCLLLAYHSIREGEEG